MADFKKRNLFDIYFNMTLEEVVDYYQQLRRMELENHDLVKGIQIRKALYRVVKVVLFLDEIMSKRRVTILKDDRLSSIDYKTREVSDYNKRNYPYKDIGKAYVATHIGRYDCESVVTAINENANILMSDPGISYKDIDGILLRIMGVTWFEHTDKLDRKYADLRETEVLRKHGNTLEFCEAGYCIDPVAPVGELHPGFARRAIKTNSIIVPVSLEQYEKDNIKDYIVNIGKSVVPGTTNIDEAEELSKFVRDEMIQLKRDIWKIYGGAKPTAEEFASDPLALDKYKDRIDFMMRDVPSYYRIVDIAKELYRPSELAIKSLKDINYL